MTSSEIRQAFLDFFKSKGHTIVPSAPIVIKNDPTLLFTNAGMNQFKDYFLGNKTPEHKRVADTQKCLRVSGKHNDLEEVGVDTYHHTMFEMLGNWSFGDYFKKEAIAWSWELLTEVYKIPQDKLYVTVFEGDEKEGLPFDEEAYNEWKKHIAEDRILKGNKKDNFWEMGDTGPCGPCSEIHVDCRSEEERKQIDGKTLVNADHPQVIEIWNNVFMQFNRLKDGSLQNLPAKHVDTGMGFERLVRVLQGKQSNYDTDVFTGTISEIEKIVNKTYAFSDSKQDVAFRVLADHIRAIAFTISDGQLPSNTGAGYVIRRILRRAVRYYFSYLDYKTPLLFQLIPHIAQQFEHVFPELKAQQDFVTKVIKEEEDAFLRTLDRGLKRIDELISAEKTVNQINGKDAFELYDTYGFPIDLTRLIASENNLSVDEDGFNQEMQQQKNRSRAATAIDTEDWITINEVAKTSFIGYDNLETETKVVKYRKVKSKNKEQFQIVLEQTPFYAESGGQVGDVGQLIINNEELKIIDTKKENGEIIHFADKIVSDFNFPVVAKVNAGRRLQITLNHSATHLLHAALKEVLGKHVNQKGSLVSPDLLRFDVSHFAKITDEELRKAETIVNAKIRENIPVVIKEMPKDEALKLGAMALFGEKYGDVVRVVMIDPNFSIELCGGTHVGFTGQIGLFKITAESAVAAGVRRIEALTGEAAFQYVSEKTEQVKIISELLKTKEPIKAIEKLQEEKSVLGKRIENLEARQLVGIRNELLQKDELLNVKTQHGQEFAISFIGSVIEVSNADALKKLALDLKNNLRDYVAVLGANIGGKPFVAVGISETVVTALNLDAAKIIKENIAPLIKGGGGGQKTLATAGGQDASNLAQVIEAVKNLIV
ncbi:alanine--tRNA ligase [Arachidicoccus ginsenosidimutans]|uniref:alanine--tRNA ligase n=1 Tax=Arachidicoccus sp. BS20 TaxID=1850526 RepID=UPI0007F140CC|nr:alanine--tRNA ligase [Arachidicoccus sp. BS20]ANI89946.1 alanine--tRNA ligase [Arachidicoccus sp. BS20]